MSFALPDLVLINHIDSFHVVQYRLTSATNLLLACSMADVKVL